jgi:hypothetical protein
MAGLSCPECGNKLVSRARTCPKCGAPQPSSILLKLGILALIAVTLAATAFAIARNRRAASGIGSNIAIDSTQDTETVMKETAERYILRALAAPATAKFAPPAEWETTPIDASTSRMHAWVDSENASGATLRAIFTIAIRLNKGTASLLYLQFDDDDKPMFGVRPLTDEEKNAKSSSTTQPELAFGYSRYPAFPIRALPADPCSVAGDTARSK